jgi:serine/threonine-protein kinase
MGRVYAARDRETGAIVALKRFDPALLAKPGADSAERLLKRARAARLLEHVNIAKVHEAGETAGTVYVVMEMLEGESLRKILDAGPLPIGRAIRIAREMAGGLAHAHIQGVVHGGIKPSNAIVLRSGAVKITDFGLAQAAPPSPEQMGGEPVDHRCDIFALGALFYEMLTHRPPAAEPLPPSELNPHVPRALDGIVLSMLARQAASRMAGIPLLLPALQRLEEGLGFGAAASVSAAEPAMRTPGIKRLRERESMREIPRVDEPTEHEAFDYQKAIAMMDRESRPQRSSGSRRTIWAPLILILALPGIGAAGYVYYSSWGGEARIENVLTRLAASPRTPVRAPDPMPAKPRVTDPPPPAPPAPVAQTATTERPVVHAPEEHEPAQAAPVQKASEATQAVAKVLEPQPGAAARVTLEISPRGEIYIDGKHQGTAPPTTTFDLEPGMHRIEVRSGSRTPYLTYMVVQAGDVRRIRYDFDTSRAVYPRNASSSRDSRRAAR